MSAPVAHPELRAALIAELEERAPRVEVGRIGACFDFAAAAHGPQQRESGEPYVSHVVEVCRILLDLLDTRLDTPLACAGLLHDVVEDTPVTLEEVEKRFGREVAALVGGVTKLSGLHFDSQEAEQAENFRRMVLSMARDLRVIFVKLADRLHNMRTIQYLKPEKARRIAEETRDIYAPLAHRLGIASVKRELEDLSLKTLDPEAYEELAIGLARNPARLDSVKAKLARNRLTTPLFDTAQFTRNLEAAYTAMMERHRAGHPPAHIRVPQSTPGDLVPRSMT